MKLAEIETRATHITSVFSPAKSFSSDPISKPEEYVIQAESLKEKLREDCRKLEQQEEEAFDMINVLTDSIERGILIDYHLNKVKIRELENIYHYSERQIYNIRQRAYENIADNFRF